MGAPSSFDPFGVAISLGFGSVGVAHGY